MMMKLSVVENVKGTEYRNIVTRWDKKHKILSRNFMWMKKLLILIFVKVLGFAFFKGYFWREN